MFEAPHRFRFEALKRETVVAGIPLSHELLKCLHAYNRLVIDLEKEEDRTRLTYTYRTLLQSADDEGSFVGLPYVLLSMACVPRAKVLNDCVRVALVEGILKRDQKWAVEGVDHGLQHRPGSAIQCVFADVPWEGSVSISTVSKGTNASYTHIRLVNDNKNRTPGMSYLYGPSPYTPTRSV